MTDPIRLSKRLIELVGCSRREAELFIEGGWVTVDGEVIDEPQFKVGDQKVELDTDAKATAPEPVTILLNVPAGMDAETAMATISAETLSEEHRYGKRPLKGHFLRLTASTDLQANASGLLVFTQDWKILRKLTADASKIEQEYVVEVEGDMVAHGLNRLQPRPDLQGQGAAAGEGQLAERKPPAVRHEEPATGRDRPVLPGRRPEGRGHPPHPYRRRVHRQSAPGAMALPDRQREVLRRSRRHYISAPLFSATPTAELSGLLT